MPCGNHGLNRPRDSPHLRSQRILGTKNVDGPDPALPDQFPCHGTVKLLAAVLIEIIAARKLSECSFLAKSCSVKCRTCTLVHFASHMPVRCSCACYVYS